jgi:hypothetical protein
MGGVLAPWRSHPPAHLRSSTDWRAGGAWRPLRGTTPGPAPAAPQVLAELQERKSSGWLPSQAASAEAGLASASTLHLVAMAAACLTCKRARDLVSKRRPPAACRLLPAPARRLPLPPTPPPPRG